MARSNRILDYRKMYPKANDEVIAILKKTERKMQYQEYDLKAERTKADREKGTVAVIPCREDSYERLEEQDIQFAAESESVEEQLHKAIGRLTEKEQYLIQQLYFEERTERKLAQELGLCRNAVHKKKKQALDRLKQCLEG